METSEVFDSDEYYSRQTVLRELGSQGQEKLKCSKVVIVGLGGLGSVSTLNLALAGVGYLRLVDLDTVELNNLHRQVLYSLDDLRYPKVEAATQRIQKINPEVRVEPIPENVRVDNVDALVEDMDCVIDGLDNMATRYLLNRACTRHRIPYVFGGAIGIEGNLTVFSPPETPCLECILPNLDDRRLPTCQTRGVLGATTGIIGTMQAMEGIKLLTGIGDPLKGKLMVCDFRDMYVTTLDIRPQPDCPICQEPVAQPTKEGSDRLVWLCSSKTANINPPQPMATSLDEVYSRLKPKFKILLKSALVLVFEYNQDVEVSLFQGGRMLLKNVQTEDDAKQIYNDIMGRL